MATPYCTACGQTVPAGATFCPRCGVSILAAAPPSGATAPSYAAFGRGGLPDPRTTPEGRATEIHGLHAVRIAMLLTVVGVGVGLVEEIAGGYFPFISVTQTGSGVGFALANLDLFAALFAAAAGLTIAEFVFLRIGLASLARVNPRQSTPAALAIVALVGLLMVFGGIALLLDALNQAIQCAAGVQPFPSSCVLNGTFWSSIALLGIGGLLALIGYIGVLIGLYRIGAEYRDSTVKVGTILLIIPFVSLVGAILIWYRIGEILDRQGRPVSPGFAP